MINSQDFIDWQTLPSSQFSYTAILDSKIILKEDLVIRSVSTSANSYVELWLWTDDYKEIIGLIDKVFLDVEIFNLKSMKLYDSFLMLLD